MMKSMMNFERNTFYIFYIKVYELNSRLPLEVLHFSENVRNTKAIHVLCTKVSGNERFVMYNTKVGILACQNLKQIKIFSYIFICFRLWQARIPPLVLCCCAAAYAGPALLMICNVIEVGQRINVDQSFCQCNLHCESLLKIVPCKIFTVQIKNYLLIINYKINVDATTPGRSISSQLEFRFQFYLQA